MSSSTDGRIPEDERQKNADSKEKRKEEHTIEVLARPQRGCHTVAVTAVLNEAVKLVVNQKRSDTKKILFHFQTITTSTSDPAIPLAEAFRVCCG